MRVVASDHAQRRLADLILFSPHQSAAPRRPRTEARPRRKDARKRTRGIDKPTPVTEARMERKRNAGPGLGPPDVAASIRTAATRANSSPGLQVAPAATFFVRNAR